MVKAATGIMCPQCGDSRSTILEVSQTVHNQVRRRRKCANGHRYRTYENVDDDGAEG